MKSLRENFDAVVLAGGAEAARPAQIPGAELPGVRLAMEFLTQQNKRVAGDAEERAAPRGTLTATGKDVIVIGGGDTGSDCVGTSNRQGAQERHPDRDHAQAAREGGQGADLAELADEAAHLVEPRGRRRARLVGPDQRSRRRERPGRPASNASASSGSKGQMKEIAGSEFVLPADLILLAMGFVGPRRPG